MLVIIIKNLDGSVGIMSPAPGCGLTVEQIAAKDVPAGVPFEIVDAESIPKDRTFRNAWGHDLKPNLAKAKILAAAESKARHALALRDPDANASALRAKHGKAKDDIAAAASVEALKTILESL